MCGFDAHGWVSSRPYLCGTIDPSANVVQEDMRVDILARDEVSEGVVAGGGLGEVGLVWL